MLRTLRIPFALFLFALACLPARPQTITVTGADLTGHRDSRAILQKAIDSAVGRTVFLPRGIYLLDSYRPSTHPWKFYNLRVPSHVTIAGEPGAILLQGKHGRAPLPPHADYVETDVVAIGTAHYQEVTFQKPQFNGGFLLARATHAGAKVVDLDNPGDAGRFAAGDWIAIYAATGGDVIPGETSQVTGVDRSTGSLSLAHPLARSFPRAFVSNVTRLATVHVALRNLTIQGSVPLAATEVFDLALHDCRLLYDPTGGEKSIVTGLMANTIRGFRMENGSIEPAGSDYRGLELPQRDSQDVAFDQVTFKARNVVFGEFAAHWTFTGNHFWIYPDRSTPVGIATGGLDVELLRNLIHGGDITAGGGSGSLLSDAVGLPDYLRWVGRIRYRDNAIECRADGNNCVRLTTRDPLVENNHITATGSACGIKVEGATNFVLRRNTIQVGSSPAVIVNVPAPNAGVLKDNSLSGSGPFAILIKAPPTTLTDKSLIAENSFSGFRDAVSRMVSAPAGK